MKIGILVSNIGNFGTKGLYNSQEIGMAKKLNKNGNEVIIYKFISNKVNRTIQVEEIKKNIVIKYIPVNSIGTHGISNLNELDYRLDVLIHFSDIQLIFTKVYKWCHTNNIKLIPYIGVIESNNTNKIKSFITNTLSKINLHFYKKCFTLAKTTNVKKKLIKNGVKEVEILPVGLDIDLLNKNYLLTTKKYLKKKYNLDNDDKVLLFIGRLDEEKRPIEAIEIFNSLYNVNKKYKMILVGKGKLKEKVLSKIDEYKLNTSIIYIESIPNNEIWELYHLSDYFINLNTNEIFGMAILEAMYYRCCVIARNAPGPNFILSKPDIGYLADNNEKIKDIILNSEIEKVKIEENAYNLIINKFLWNKIETILNLKNI